MESEKGKVRVWGEDWESQGVAQIKKLLGAYLLSWTLATKEIFNRAIMVVAIKWIHFKKWEIYYGKLKAGKNKTS